MVNFHHWSENPPEFNIMWAVYVQFTELNYTVLTQKQDVLPALCQRWSCCLGYWLCTIYTSKKIITYILMYVPAPANTAYRACAGLMMLHRLRRWPTIKPAQGRCCCAEVTCGALLVRPNQHCRLHTKRSNWLLFKWAVTALCVYRAEYRGEVWPACVNKLAPRKCHYVSIWHPLTPNTHN